MGEDDSFLRFIALIIAGLAVVGFLAVVAAHREPELPPMCPSDYRPVCVPAPL